MAGVVKMESSTVGEAGREKDPQWAFNCQGPKQALYNERAGGDHMCKGLDLLLLTWGFTHTTV